MGDYLFGDYYRSHGEINGLPVSVRTENGNTTVRMGDQVKVFHSRTEAFNFLRNKANLSSRSETVESVNHVSMMTPVKRL